MTKQQLLESLQYRADGIGLTVEEVGDPSEVGDEGYVISYYGVPKMRSNYKGICTYMSGWADSRNTLDPCPPEFGCPQCGPPSVKEALESVRKDPGVFLKHYVQVSDNPTRLQPIEIRKGDLPSEDMLDKTGYRMKVDDHGMVTLLRRDETELRLKMDKLYGVQHDPTEHVYMVIAPVNFANLWLTCWNSCLEYHRAMAVE
jgi:hypothetical protein